MCSILGFFPSAAHFPRTQSDRAFPTSARTRSFALHSFSLWRAFTKKKNNNKNKQQAHTSCSVFVFFLFNMPHFQSTPSSRVASTASCCVLVKIYIGTTLIATALQFTTTVSACYARRRARGRLTRSQQKCIEER